MPIDEDAIRFPYYGNTLRDLTKGKSLDEAADVIVRGDDGAAELEDFAAEVFLELKQRFDLTDAKLREAGGDPKALRRGILNWEWVQTILKGLEKYVPGSSGASVAVFTNDVHQYLSNFGFQAEINNGVTSAFDSAKETVVVSHSLGTIVAYQVLRTNADNHGWRIPMLVTLGSPLGITAIKRRLAPLKRPSAVKAWFNAMDEGDVVALYPLNPDVFRVTPAIENKIVENHTENKHGIVGYLDVPEVAQRIYGALVAD
jgi:pimeloyl-ACP methyl ester carboxylesterase